MELNEKQVLEIKERLMAIQELIADIDEVLSVESSEIEPEKKVEAKAEKPKAEPKAEPKAKEVSPLEAIIAKEKLDELDEAELKDILDEYEIKYSGKNKKASLVEKVAQGILDGVIQTSDEESSEEESEEVAEDTELSVKETAEKAVQDEIDGDVKSGKLTAKIASAWLKKHLANSECKGCPKGCKDDPIQCYTQIKVSHVDDEGNVMADGEAYMRDDAVYCCGVECEEAEDDKVVCTVCGQLWEVGEE